MKLETIAERMNSNDRAVSPVIGVILMVAITVILAAVIGTFVLDLGQSAGQSAPQASLQVSVDAPSDTFTVSHKGGDQLLSSDSKIVIRNETGSSGSLTLNSTSAEQQFSVGDEFVITTNNANVTSGTWDTMSDDSPASVDGYGLVSGQQYTIQLVDLDSQRVVWETTVTA